MYDINKLYLETDKRGFVLNESRLNQGVLAALAGFLLGQSRLNQDAITNDQGIWKRIEGDFTSINYTRSVSVEHGFLIRPEATALTVTTRDTDYIKGLVGKQLRLRYGNQVLFTGTVRNIRVAVDVDTESNGPEYKVTIAALDALDDLVNYVHEGFTAPQESVADRLLRVWPKGGLSYLPGAASRTMAERLEAENPTALDLLQDAADVQRARFYLDSQNTIIIDGQVPEEPSVFFSDVEEAGTFSYTGLDFEHDRKHSFSAVIAEAKQDKTVTATKTVPGASFDNHEKVTVDVPATQAAVDEWVSTAPLRGTASLEPTRLSTPFREGLLPVDVLQLAGVRLNDKTYDVGIASVIHTITPKKWLIDLDLVPAHVLTSTAITPSAAEDLGAQQNNSTITLTWEAPTYFGDATGYELRYAVGPIPPTKTSGMSLATLSRSTSTYQHTGVAPATNYSYSLFTITADPSVYSDRATVTLKTREDN